MKRDLSSARLPETCRTLVEAGDLIPVYVPREFAVELALQWSDESLRKAQSLLPESSAFRFARSGDGYDITGFGEHGHLKRILGLDYLHRLVEQPGRHLSPEELTLSGAHHNAEKSAQPVLDREAKSEYSREISRLSEEKIKHESEGNDLEAKHCQEEIEKIIKHLENATGLSGCSRVMKKRTDNSIQNNLKRAYDKMRKCDPSMAKIAEHFQMHVGCESGQFCYRCNTIEWTTI